MVWPYKAIYIHVPFCRQACSYCNFYFETPSSYEKAFPLNESSKSFDVRTDKKLKSTSSRFVAENKHLSSSTSLFGEEAYNKFTSSVLNELDAQKKFFNSSRNLHKEQSFPLANFRFANGVKNNAISPFFAKEKGSVYFGGGTPSLLSSELLAKIIAKAKETFFGFSSNKEENCSIEMNNFQTNTTEDCPLEVTLEANPEDVNENNAKAWKMAGVNRVSLGVQTNTKEGYVYLGRAGSWKLALKSLAILTRQQFSISVDLIIGHAGGKVSDLLNALEELTSNKYNVQHFSLYLLEVVEGTALHRQITKYKKKSNPESELVHHYTIANNKLLQLGYTHYEISSYAKNNHYSRHNSAYWFHLPYLGLGPSAESFDGINVRYKNLPDVAKYNECWESSSGVRTTNVESNVGSLGGAANICSKEMLSTRQLKNEYIMLRLRTTWGIELLNFYENFGHDATVQFCKTAALLEKSKLLVCSLSENTVKCHEVKFMDEKLIYAELIKKNANYSLSLQGKLVADAVAAEFF